MLVGNSALKINPISSFSSYLSHHLQNPYLTTVDPEIHATFPHTQDHE